MAELTIQISDELAQRLEPLLDLAVEAQADYIITYNQKDLQPASKFGIQVVTPKQFLQSIGEIA